MIIKKIINRAKLYQENIEFRFFKYILKKYNFEFFYRDSLGILSKRIYSDNFSYIFKTGNSTDAFPLMLSLSDKINNLDISIDVGANIGITTIWMAKGSKKVYSFEPEKENISRLEENLIVNNIKNVEIIKKAVSDKDEEVGLNIYKGIGHHSLSDKHLSSAIDVQKVEAVSLDEFCKTKNINKIDFLKIDVEGFELEVLKGAKNLLKNKSIKLIAFEHSKILLEKQNRDLSDVFNFLTENHYKVFNLNNIEIKNNDIDNLIQEDLYAI